MCDLKNLISFDSFGFGLRRLVFEMTDTPSDLTPNKMGWD